jgi:hypothetical protein
MSQRKRLYPSPHANIAHTLIACVNPPSKELTTQKKRTYVTPTPTKPFSEEGQQYGRHELLKLTETLFPFTLC